MVLFGQPALGKHWTNPGVQCHDGHYDKPSHNVPAQQPSNPTRLFHPVDYEGAQGSSESVTSSGSTRAGRHSERKNTLQRHHTVGH